MEATIPASVNDVTQAADLAIAALIDTAVMAGVTIPPDLTAWAGFVMAGVAADGCACADVRKYIRISKGALHGKAEGEG